MSRESDKRNERTKVYSFLPTGDYYFNKGIQAYDRFDFANAKKYLQRALELEPAEPMIACQLALVCTETGEYAKSNELLHAVLDEMDSRMTECHYFLANNYAHLGVFTEAYHHAKYYLEKDTVGEFADEADELLEWLGINEDDNLSWLKSQEELVQMQEDSKQLLEEGKYEDAVRMLEKIIKKHPDFWPAYNNLALAYFYEGQVSKAFSLTEKVLGQNSGNLHALCNLAVFYYYEQQTEDLQELLETLDKIKPMIPEHRYKLGATFALTKQYVRAYQWLKQLYKSGYDGDAGYYYWLAKSANQTGNERVAKAAWEQLVLLDPDKAGAEPWNEALDHEEEVDAQSRAIFEMLRSDHVPERLCAIFYISIARQKNELLAHPSFSAIDELSFPEKLYLAAVLQVEKKQALYAKLKIEKAHETALCLYEHHKDNPEVANELLMTWFRVFQGIVQTAEKFTNPQACAAAVEMVWSNWSNQRKTQQETARKYGISPSTLRKYVSKLEQYLP